MAGADWNAIEAGLQGWVKAALGCDNRHAYWANPNVTRPTDGAPFAVLEITDRRALGVTPQVIQTDHLTNPAGQEIELEARQVMDCGFRVQVYAPPARGTHPGTPRGPANAAALAGKVRLAVALPSVSSALDDLGVSVYDLGSVTYVPELVGTDFEGRAVLEARFYVADSASEFTGYIETVQVADPFGGSETIDVYSDPEQV